MGDFISDFMLTFMSIIFEAMPFIVFGALLSGAMEELLPQKFFTRFMPKSRLVAIIASSFMGVLLPMCECGIVPVMRRLLSKGVPASCAITYMLSAPIINVIVLSSTSLAFWGTYDLWGVPGLAMVLLRGGLAFIVAVSIGIMIDGMTRRGEQVVKSNVVRVRLVESNESLRLLEEDNVVGADSAAGHVHGPECAHEHAPGEACSHDHAHEHHDHGHDHKHEHADHHHDHAHEHAHAHEHSHAPKKKSLLDRLTAIADIALSDFLDIAAFLVIGAALAATVNTTLKREELDRMGEYKTASIAGMMGLAILLSLCSEADAFVAANFTGFSTGAKIGFLVLGPMLDIKLFIMYQWVFTRNTVWKIVIRLLITVFILAWLVNLFEPQILGLIQSTRGASPGAAS